MNQFTPTQEDAHRVIGDHFEKTERCLLRKPLTIDDKNDFKSHMLDALDLMHLEHNKIKTKHIHNTK